MWGLSLRGWHIIGAGLIWLASAILAFMNLFSAIWLGVIFILLGLFTISIGMFKIVKFERHEKVRGNVISATEEGQLAQIRTTQPYSTFNNDQDVIAHVDGQEDLDPNDPNIRFSKKFQNQLKLSN